MRRRGRYVERSFAHVYDRGVMRPTHLRGHANISSACSFMPGRSIWDC
jgi:coproporphyrinogen III oxidase